MSECVWAACQDDEGCLYPAHTDGVSGPQPLNKKGHVDLSVSRLLQGVFEVPYSDQQVLKTEEEKK